MSGSHGRIRRRYRTADCRCARPSPRTRPPMPRAMVPERTARGGRTCRARGTPSGSLIPGSSPVTRWSPRPTRRRGTESPSRATGPCRVSATFPTTRTSTCPGADSRPTCPRRSPPSSTAGRSRCPPRGATDESSSTWEGQRACTGSGSTATTPDGAPTVVCRVSTTSRTSCARGPTTSPSSSAASRPRAISRTRTSGGWRVCIARCSSRPGGTSTWPTSGWMPASTPPPCGAPRRGEHSPSPSGWPCPPARARRGDGRCGGISRTPTAPCGDGRGPWRCRRSPPPTCGGGNSPSTRGPRVELRCGRQRPRCCTAWW